MSARCPKALQIAASVAWLVVLLASAASATSAGRARLATSLSPALAQATALGALDPAQELHFAITLPVRDRAALDDFIRRLYTPGDPAFGRYLATGEFAGRFGPSQADYDAVLDYARAQGLRIENTFASRTVVDVAGPVARVEQALGVHMQRYRSAAGRLFQAPDAEPTLPSAIAARVGGIVGLDDAVEPTPNLVPRPLHPAGSAAAEPNQIGTGPGNALSPADVKTAYNLNGIIQQGVGQRVALYERNGYTAADITAYEDQFGLQHVLLNNVLLNGYNGVPTPPTAGNPTPSGPVEVTLDIELAIALAPGLDQIDVYEGTNTVDIYTRIANDNLAAQVSTSWYNDRDSDTPQATRDGEAAAFAQMAAQGQSFLAASGDFGDKVKITDAQGNVTLKFGVQDPCSQFYATAVGGTTLATNGAGGAWQSESAWSGSGGGISPIVALPAYQSGIVPPGSNGSATQRNVPDISLDSDPSTGYAINFLGNWYAYGGTSCAAPLWAAYIALVNHHRAQNAIPRLGFLNPSLYWLANTVRYANDFHDIATGNNGTYPAVARYDNVTGLGTIDGGAMFNDLMFNGASAYWVDGGSVQPFEFGTPAFPFKSIAAAVNIAPASAPSLVYVRGGTYTEHFTVTKPVLIVNNGGGPVIWQ